MPGILSGMNANPNANFGGLFGTTWNAFKSNYGRCLGLSLVAVIVACIALVVAIVFGVTFSSPESMQTGNIAFITSYFIIEILFVYTILAILSYMLVRKLRGEGTSRSGWFSRVLVIGFLAQLVMLPGLVCSQLGNPGQWEELKLAPEAMAASFQAEMEKQNTTASQDENAKKETENQGAAQKRLLEIEAEVAVLQSKRNSVLGIAGLLLSIAGGFYIITWMPWALLAACDSRETCQGISETIRRGREIARGANVAIIGTGVVLGIIAYVSFLLCFLPGFLFGFPLLFAWIPAVYVTLRDTDESVPPVQTA